MPGGHLALFEQLRASVRVRVRAKPRFALRSAERSPTRYATGEVAGPIRFGNEAIIVLQLLGRTPPPAYETVREAMCAKATNDALDRQEKAWLAELRRSACVDVRA